MINTVKQQENGWLVNGNMFVPNDKFNRHYVEVQEWITNGGAVEPQYTDEELAKIDQDKINNEARAYLASTDWYITRLAETNKKVPKEILEKREQARSVINK